MVDPKLIDSKALGAIPVTSLSGGTKTLILIYNEPQQIFIAPTCGDNCAKWFLKIAKEKRSYYDQFTPCDGFWKGNFEIKILNNNAIVHNMEDMSVMPDSMYKAMELPRKVVRCRRI